MVSLLKEVSLALVPFYAYNAPDVKYVNVLRRQLQFKQAIRITSYVVGGILALLCSTFLAAVVDLLAIPSYENRVMIYSAVVSLATVFIPAVFTVIRIPTRAENLLSECFLRYSKGQTRDLGVQNVLPRSMSDEEYIAWLINRKYSFPPVLKLFLWCIWGIWFFLAYFVLLVISWISPDQQHVWLELLHGALVGVTSGLLFAFLVLWSAYLFQYGTLLRTQELLVRYYDLSDERQG